MVKAAREKLTDMAFDAADLVEIATMRSPIFNLDGRHATETPPTEISLSLQGNSCLLARMKRPSRASEKRR